MSSVVQLCIHLLTQQHASDPDANEASRDDADEAVFLLSALCQLYLDTSDGKCHSYQQIRLGYG